MIAIPVLNGAERITACPEALDFQGGAQFDAVVLLLDHSTDDVVAAIAWVVRMRSGYGNREAIVRQATRLVQRPRLGGKGGSEPLYAVQHGSKTGHPIQLRPAVARVQSSAFSPPPSVARLQSPVAAAGPILPARDGKRVRRCGTSQCCSRSKYR